MKIQSKDIRIVPISEIRPNPNNRNKHGEDQIERLSDLIRYQGFRQPLVVSNQSGLLVTGHGRLLAAKKLRMPHVPVLFQDFETTDIEYAFAVSDNSIAEWAELDLSGINLDVGQLGPDFDLKMLGLKDFTLDVSDKDKCDEDDAPEVQSEAKSKLGDLWLLGDHRLLCGDSTDRAQVERLMAGEQADMVFTDPPYGVSWQNNAVKRFEVIENDDKILDIFPVIHSVMKPNSAAFIWTAQSVYPIWRNQFEPIYKSTVIWNKSGGGKGDLRGDFMPTYEMALFCVNGRVEFMSDRQPAVWDISKDAQQDYKHPTQKPVALAEQAMRCFVGSNSIVVDLFGGSGSTLIACHKTNRRCFIMEIDPHYIDVILARFAKYSGLDPVREDGVKWSELQ